MTDGRNEACVQCYRLSFNTATKSLEVQGWKRMPSGSCMCLSCARKNMKITDEQLKETESDQIDTIPSWEWTILDQVFGEDEIFGGMVSVEDKPDPYSERGLFPVKNQIHVMHDTTPKSLLRALFIAKVISVIPKLLKEGVIPEDMVEECKQEARRMIREWAKLHWEESTEEMA